MEQKAEQGLREIHIGTEEGEVKEQRGRGGAISAPTPQEMTVFKIPTLSVSTSVAEATDEGSMSMESMDPKWGQDTDDPAIHDGYGDDASDASDAPESPTGMRRARRTTCSSGVDSDRELWSAHSPTEDAAEPIVITGGESSEHS